MLPYSSLLTTGPFPHSSGRGPWLGTGPLLIAASPPGIPARHLSLAYMQHAPALTPQHCHSRLYLGLNGWA